MATHSVSRRAARTLTWLLVLFLAVGALIFSGGGSWTPKLALDLEGGTQIILAPQISEGTTLTEEQLQQAVSIIRQRVDAAGVSESEVTTQGGTNIVVSIPGTPDQDTLDRIRSSAKLEFRAVLLANYAQSLDAASTTGSASDGASPSPTPSDNSGIPTEWTEPTATPTDGSDLNWISSEIYKTYLDSSCDEIENSGANLADPTKPLVVCSDDGLERYILGPVEVDGADIADASANYIYGSNGVQTNEWGVYLKFDAKGTTAFAAVTARLTALTGSQNQFAIVLDGKVISAPRTEASIPDGKPVISGTFTEETAKTLADQLKFGALPIGFKVQSSDTVTPTLGVAQLQSGLIAGAIGILLVIIYSLVQYRALALVTIGSLVVASGLTYLAIVYLATSSGYRLSLAGVAGLIVSIGITVDSFIVYFERVRDELREGRPLFSAVESGWNRARRTIIISDTVNLLAAIILFALAVGNVRGFAFTLGVTTVVDLAVVMMFTHPILQLLSQTRFFSSGNKWSGLNPDALGAIYRGRAKFRVDDQMPQTKLARSAKEARKRQSIAERKAAADGGAE